MLLAFGGLGGIAHEMYTPDLASMADDFGFLTVRCERYSGSEALGVVDGWVGLERNRFAVWVREDGVERGRRGSDVVVRVRAGLRCKSTSSLCGRKPATSALSMDGCKRSAKVSFKFGFKLMLYTYRRRGE